MRFTLEIDMKRNINLNEGDGSCPCCDYNENDNENYCKMSAADGEVIICDGDLEDRPQRCPLRELKSDRDWKSCTDWDNSFSNTLLAERLREIKEMTEDIYKDVWALWNDVIKDRTKIIEMRYCISKFCEEINSDNFIEKEDLDD